MIADTSMPQGKFTHDMICHNTCVNRIEHSLLGCSAAERVTRLWGHIRSSINPAHHVHEALHVCRIVHTR